MATYRVRDRSGATLDAAGKEQADAWVAVGYVLVGDDEAKPTRKAPAKKTAAKPSKK